MKKITVFNLQVMIPVHSAELPFADEYVIIGPISRENLTMPKTAGFIRSLLQEAEKTPKFDIHDDVHIVAPPTVQSMCMIATIMTAFDSVTIWFTGNGTASFVDLNSFIAEGKDFAMTYPHNKNIQIITSDIKGE